MGIHVTTQLGAHVVGATYLNLYMYTQGVRIMNKHWTLYHDYQMGAKLAAEIIRSGVARGLYTKALGDRMIEDLVTLELTLRNKAQTS